MSLVVTDLQRRFKFNDETLPDPDPTMSVDEVLSYYSLKYPELTTATVKQPELGEEYADYEFTTTVGTKG